LKELNVKTKSRFIKVRCKSCGNEQIIFDRASREIECRICGDTLAKPTGGAVLVKGEVIETFE